jgi:hypothetical protein
MPLNDTEEGARRTEQLAPKTAAPPRFALGGLVDSVAARIPPGRRLPLATYLVCQAIFLFWLAAYYPALLTFDSVTYVLHVTTGPWVNNHSVLYDAMVWLSLHATGGLAALAFAQTVAMSAALAYTVAAFRRIGVPGRWTAVAAIIVAALPPLASFTIYIWKDVPFAICGYLVVPTLAHLISLRKNPGWRTDRRVNLLIGALGLELLGLCLFRLNGFLVVGGAGIALVILLSGIRVRLAAIVVTAILLTFMLNLYILPALGIQKTPKWMAFAPVYSDIAVAYAKDPAIFTTADKNLMAEVLPLTQWAVTANCYDSDWTTQNPGFTTRSEEVAGQLLSLWRRVLGRAPNLILAATICRGSIAWSIFPGPAQLDGDTIKYDPPTSFGVHDASRVPNNPYRQALRARPLSWKAYSAASLLWRASMTRQLDWLLWRGAFWSYLSYLVVFLFARARRNWTLLSLPAIVLAQQLAVLAENHAQSFRYMVSPIMIGIMLVPLLLARKPTVPQVMVGAERDYPG